MKALTIILCMMLLVLIVWESIPAEKIEEIPVRVYVNPSGMVYGEFFGHTVIIL